MSSSQNDLLEKPRLNPFVLPAETKIRFMMLVVAALTLTCQTGVVFTVLVVNLTDLQLMQQAFFKTAEVLGGRAIWEIDPGETGPLGDELTALQKQALISGLSR